MSPPQDAGAGAAAASDLDWLEPLLARYRRVLGSAGGTDGGPGGDSGGRAPPDAMIDGFNELRLASTAAARLAALESAADPGAAIDQLVVLGPTQAGKSTLVDALLDARVAGISALAGHTVHAQAFGAGIDADIGAGPGSAGATLALLDTLMAPLARADRDALERDALGTWSWQDVRPGSDAQVRSGGTVVWDTPDFDSIESGTYREAVLASAGLADRIVLALSKDKYGDRSVWDVLGRVRALGVPVLVVVNKLDAADESTVLGAFARHHEERFGTPPPPIVALPWSEAARAGEARVRVVLPEAFRRATLDAHAVGARRAALAVFVAERRHAWLAPLRDEAEARRTWFAAVGTVERDALAGYERRWLDDPRRYDTFERTLAELLVLLEVPGLARTLGRARQVVTWPARTLLGLGRGALSREPARTVDREVEVLVALYDEAATALRESVLARIDGGRDAAWWRALERELVAGRHALRARWVEEVAAVRRDMAPRIEAAARELHERLRAQPALLNALRATRVTTDAAGVALAFKSGGLAPTDLVLAPAMLSLTTLLTESALGRWLDAIKGRLRREQRELVREHLVEGVLGEAYRRAAEGGGGVRLSAGALEPALRRELKRD